MLTFINLLCRPHQRCCVDVHPMVRYQAQPPPLRLSHPCRITIHREAGVAQGSPMYQNTIQQEVGGDQNSDGAGHSIAAPLPPHAQPARPQHQLPAHGPPKQAALPHLGKASLSYALDAGAHPLLI